MPNAYAIKPGEFTFSLMDLYEAKRSPDMRLTPIAFGEDEGKLAVGSAPAWKGTMSSYPELKELREVNPDVAEGLENAIEVSKQCEGIKGVVTRGGVKIPKKADCQINPAKYNR